MKLSRKNTEDLLGIAKSSILHHLNEKAGVLALKSEYFDTEIKVKAGAFVSVYTGNDLRGCIGTFSETDPLYENVSKMAVSAAFFDGRFRPISSRDINNLKIEISVLTPRKRIYSPTEIEIGRHGIYIVSGGRRGTLLPQVASKNSWSAMEFLEYCSIHKAGLIRDGWKEAELYTYEAIVFST